MFYTLKLAFKNIFSRKSSFVIVLFITFAITMFIVVNAIFDGTDNGIKTVFMDSFTGDLIIREKTSNHLYVLLMLYLELFNGAKSSIYSSSKDKLKSLL